MNKITLAIADSNIMHALEIKKYIEANNPDINILPPVTTVKEIISVIKSEAPDIVISDLVFSDMSAIDVIRAEKSGGRNFHLIIFTDVASFEYACEAINLGVSAYILKSAYRTELNLTINRIITDITLDSTHNRGAESLRLFFFNEVTRSTDLMKYSLSNINRIYCTNFRPGLLKVLHIKLDFDADADSFFNKTSRIFQDLRNILIVEYADIVYEIIPNEKYDGSFFLLNYAAEQDQTVNEVLENRIMPKFAAYCTRFYKLHITVGVGSSTTFFNQIYRSEKGAAYAIWCRMRGGLDKVYYWDRLSPRASEADIDRIQQIADSIYTAFLLIDINSAQKGLDALFSLPDEVKCTQEFKDAVTSIRRAFFDLHASILQQKYNIGELVQQIAYSFHMCQTFDTLSTEIKRVFSELMDEAIQLDTNPKSKYVKDAIRYVEKNYSSDLSLNTIADKLNISPAYLSSLFTKEIGQNYIQYVNYYRIEIAKKLLSGTALSVNEIAEKVGFTEARYFSRIFKKMTRLTPSEFRKASSNIPV